MGETALALTDEQRADLSDPRSDYSAEDRVVVAMTYLLAGGNSREAAEKASLTLEREVKSDTIRQWKRREWWPIAEEVAKHLLQKELEAKYTRLLHLTEEKMIDRIQYGDSRLTKEGDVVRVPVTLRDLVGAHAIVSDKRAMIRGEPTSRKEVTGVDLLMALAKRFQQLGEGRRAESLPGEFEVVSDDPVEN